MFDNFVVNTIVRTVQCSTAQCISFLYILLDIFYFIFIIFTSSYQIIFVSHYNTVDEGSVHPAEPGQNATGLYRKTFELPLKWNNQDEIKENKKTKKNHENKNENENERTFIVFEGVDCCANFYLDGVYVGFSKDSCLPCEFDITDILESNKRSKEHVLSVQVGLIGLGWVALC